MKKMILCLLILLSFPISGCALLDSLVGEKEVQAVTDTGLPIYEAQDGTLTTEPKDPKTGADNAPKMIRMVHPEGGVLTGAQGLLGSFGPWGALAGTLLGAAGGVYARLRNKQRLAAVGAQKQAEAQLDLTGSALTFAIRLVEKIKEGTALDADRNGKVELAEVREWVRAQGGRFSDPEFLAEVVRIANSSLSPAESAAALKAAAAKAA